MRQTFVNLLILLVSFGLVGCSSSNTQSQNQGIGAVTGAVVGGLLGSTVGGGAGKVAAVAIGAVGGALLGGYIGKNMDSTDNTQLSTALSNNRTGRSTVWKNTKTGTTYTVTPTSNLMTVNGNPNCRKFRTTAYINGENKVQTGVACLQSNGSWKALNM